MTLAALLALWWRRDARYAHRWLGPETEAAVRHWRLSEIRTLPEHERPSALAELGRWMR